MLRGIFPRIIARRDEIIALRLSIAKDLERGREEHHYTKDMSFQSIDNHEKDSLAMEKNSLPPIFFSHCAKRISFGP